jgi:hypothetical protein
MSKKVPCIVVRVSGEAKGTEAVRRFLLAGGDYLGPKRELPSIWDGFVATALDPTKEPWFLQVTAVEKNAAMLRLNPQELVDAPAELRAAAGDHLRVKDTFGRTYNLDFAEIKQGFA